MPRVEWFWQSAASVVVTVVLFFGARAVVLRVLPASWKARLRERRGVLTSVVFGGLAAVGLSLGVAIVARAGGFAEMTPGDAYVAGPLMIGLGLVVAGFAVVSHRSW